MSPHDEDPEETIDREAILARRRRFVSTALAGITTSTLATACPCLEVAPSQAPKDDDEPAAAKAEGDDEQEAKGDDGDAVEEASPQDGEIPPPPEDAAADDGEAPEGG